MTHFFFLVVVVVVVVVVVLLLLLEGHLSNPAIFWPIMNEIE